MPTKPNRSGEQQNYIPAGNGDASGEYSTHAGSGNKNAQLKQDPSKSSKGITNNAQTVQSINDYVSRFSYYDADVKKEINDVLARGNEESNNLINNILQKEKAIPIKYRSDEKSYYEAGNKEVTFSYDELNDPKNTDFDKTFYHENGHMIDFNYYGDDRELSKDYISKQYGKSLYEVLKEEGDDFFKQGKIETLKEEVEQREKEETIKLAHMTEEEYDDYIQASEALDQSQYLYKNEESAERESLNEKQMRGEIDNKEYWKLMNEMESKYEEKRNISTKGAREIFNKHVDNIIDSKKKAHKLIEREYKEISDAIDCIYKGKENLGFGHTTKYWKESEYNRSREFFANAFGAMSLQKESVDVLKKHFPKSYNVFEEIIRSISK